MLSKGEIFVQLKNSSYIVNIISNALNNMDARLVDHGKRVAYLVYKVLKRQNKYTDKQIRDICILALIHDIGAHKTEEVHNLVAFETGAVWEHSAYGYLLAKYFSPLEHLAPILLFHHADIKELEYLHPDYREIAQIIFIADRIDVLTLSDVKDWESFAGSFDKLSGRMFEPYLIDLFFRGDGCITQEDLKFKYPPEFTNILYNSEFSAEEVDAYMNMVVLSVEFQSPQTMNHTFALMKTCEILGKKAGLNDGEIEELQTSILLHTVGNIGVALHVLESSGRLSPEELEVMKSYVSNTRKIHGSHLEDALLNIVATHHEKLDEAGSDTDGSPLRERLITISDLFCALCSKRTYKESLSKKKILSIIADMKDLGYIDPRLADVASANYEELEAGIDEITKELVATYVDLWEEYDLLLSAVDTFKDGLGDNEMLIKHPMVL